jgi:multidrug efflux pump
MLFATFLGLLLIPVFYVVVRRLLGDTLDGNSPAARTNDPERKPA